MEILHSLLHRNWSVNFFIELLQSIFADRLFSAEVTVCCKPRDRLRQRPR